jgi:hypothetical protein
MKSRAGVSPPPRARQREHATATTRAGETPALLYCPACVGYKTPFTDCRTCVKLRHENFTGWKIGYSGLCRSLVDEWLRPSAHGDSRSCGSCPPRNCGRASAASHGGGTARRAAGIGLRLCGGRVGLAGQPLGLGTGQMGATSAAERRVGASALPGAEWAAGLYPGLLAVRVSENQFFVGSR